MLGIEEITPIPEVQALIRELDPVLATDDYYLKLPHHSYAHARDEVVTEALRLNELEEVEPPLEEVLDLAAAGLAHDIRSWVPLDPKEGFRTKEERTAAIVRELLPAYGFKGQRLDNVCDAIITTAPGTICETPNQLKLRRGDISNVGSRRRPIFLATTVNLFHEEIIISRGTPLWQKFLEVQENALLQLLAQDLSIGSERSAPHGQSFNHLASINAKWLSKAVVSNPHRFVSTYRHHLKDLVPDFERIVPYIIGQVAA